MLGEQKKNLWHMATTTNSQKHCHKGRYKIGSNQILKVSTFNKLYEPDSHKN